MSQSHGQDVLLTFKPSIGMGNKGDFSGFGHGMVARPRWAGLSKASDLLGFSKTTV